MRKKLVIGNWKMNGDREQNSRLLHQIQTQYAPVDNGVSVVVCPSSVFLNDVQKLLQACGSSIKVGAQNVSEHASGAYTGEISLSMLQSLGCDYVLLGHSERRVLFAEDNVVIARKVASALKADITPVLCIGETIDEYNAGITEEIVRKQVMDVVAIVGVDNFDKVIIAYEPVWAIGTGEVATPDYAQSVHKVIRDLLRQHNSAVADKVSILYGGSVNADNAQSLFSKPDIDGALVGGASLSADQFSRICAMLNRQSIKLAS